MFRIYSAQAPFTSLLALTLLWFGVSTPLVFVGSYFGFKKETITTPVRTNQIARHIPDQVSKYSLSYYIAYVVADICGVSFE